MNIRALLLGFCFGALAPCAAFGGTLVSFYSHGWGLGPFGLLYFPHAFVVVEHSSAPGQPPQQQSFGYTAVSQGPDALTGPTQGEVIPEAPGYRRRAVLRFSVEATEPEYKAMLARVAAWGGPGSPLYDLKTHNCVGFVADLATALDLKTPTEIGEDPARYLEELRALNPDRLVGVDALASGAAPAASDR